MHLYEPFLSGAPYAYFVYFLRIFIFLSGAPYAYVLRKLFKRLPEKLKAEFIPYSRKGLGTFVKLRELVDEAAANAEYYFGKEMYENRKMPFNKPRKFAPKQTHSRNAVSVNAMKEGDVSSGKPVPCDLCRGDHKLWHCASFKQKSQKERFEFVRKYKLCFNCLQPGHRVGDCGLHRKCRECGKKHNTLLHFEYKAERSTSQAGKGPAAQPIEAPKSEVNVACNVCDVSKNVDGKKLHKVVPVKV